MDAADNAAQLTKHRLIPSHGPRTTSTSSRRSRRPTNGGSWSTTLGSSRSHPRPRDEGSGDRSSTRHGGEHDNDKAPTSEDSARPGGADPSSTDIAFAEWLLATLLVSAGAVHLALAPSHFGESTVEGVGFLVAAWLQIALAVAVLLRPSRGVIFTVIAVSAASIGAWAVSRIWGLPFGEHRATPRR